MLALIIAPRYALGGVELNDKEKAALLDRVVAEQAKVSSFWIRLRTQTLEGPNRQQRTVEFAKSADGKLYTKQFQFTPIGSEWSEDYGLGVYDGKNTFLYEKNGNSGSVRSGFNRSKEARLVYLTPPEGVNNFGNSEGTIAELFKSLQPHEWQAEISENGHDLTLIILKGSRQSWTVDLSKGAVLKEYATDIPSEDGTLRRFSTLTVHEIKEIEPGIWFPSESEAVTRYKENGEWITLRTRRQLLDARLNKPELQEYFAFQWPKGARYYDYNIRTDVIAGLDEKVLAQRIKELVAGIPAELPTTRTAPQDDILVADDLVRGSDHALGQVRGLPGRRQAIIVLLLAMICLGTGYAWLVFRKKQLAKNREFK